ADIGALKRHQSGQAINLRENPPCGRLHGRHSGPDCPQGQWPRLKPRIANSASPHFDRASIGDRETGRAPAPAGGMVMGREKLSPEEGLRERAEASKFQAEVLL